MNIFKKIFGQGKSATVKPGSAKPEKESVLTPRASELGISFLDEYIAKGGTDWVSTLKLSEVQSWTDIKSQTPEVQAEVCLWACSTGLLPGRYGNGEMRHKSHHVQRAERKLGATLLRSKLPFTEAQLSTMLRWCAARTSLDWENPVVSVIGSTERILGANAPGQTLEKALTVVLKKCRKDLWHSDTQTLRKLRARIETLLNPDLRNVSFQMPGGAWSKLIKEDISSLTETGQKQWGDLFEYAASAKGSKPSQKWLKQGAEFIESVERRRFEERLSYWMKATKIDPERPDAAIDVIKGLVWMASEFPDDGLALSVGRFAENCYVKVPGIGARSTKLGNACCVSLQNMSENATAIAELVRLRGKIKYPSVRNDMRTHLCLISVLTGKGVR